MKVPDCNNHGNCFNGECQCSRGYTGNACQQGRDIMVIMIMIMITMILVMIMIMMTMLLLTATFISSMDDNSCAWWIFPNWMLLPLPLPYKTIWEEMWNDRCCIIPPATEREIRMTKLGRNYFWEQKFINTCQNARIIVHSFVGIKENDKTRRRSTRTEIAAN